MAVALANGDKPQTDTEVEGIPSTLLEPVSVTVDNIQDTVVKDGFYTVDQICTADYAQACQTAGLS
jgi:D-xylose transport system substrate-binding protein